MDQSAVKIIENGKEIAQKIGVGRFLEIVFFLDGAATEIIEFRLEPQVQIGFFRQFRFGIFQFFF